MQQKKPKSNLEAVPKATEETIDEHNALALVPNKGTVAARLLALQQMLETPFVSGERLAKANAIVTILNVGDGEVENKATGEMIPQYLFLARMQTTVEFEDDSHEYHSYGPGDLIILGLQKPAKPNARDKYTAIIREGVDAGEEVPNILIRQLPSQRKGYSGPIVFRQLLHEDVTA